MTEKWLNNIDKTTSEFINTFKNLGEDDMNWKPDPETWSIAQNIDHLMVINESYFPILNELREGTYKAPFIARRGFIVSFFGKLILKAVQPDRKKKTKTFPIWEPSTSDLPSDILGRFEKHQDKLKNEIKAAEDLVKKGAIISSPANKNIVYKLETAFDIIIAHEQRHLAQAMELLGHKEVMKKM